MTVESSETMTVGDTIAPALDERSIEHARRYLNVMWDAYEAEGWDVPAWLRASHAVLTAVLEHWDDEVVRNV